MTLFALVALIPTSDASEIRRVRVEEARDGALRTVVQTESLDPADPGALSLAITGLATGSRLEPVVRPKSTQTRSSARVAVPAGYAGSCDLALLWSDDPTRLESLTFEATACEDDCAWQEAALSDGSRVRVKLEATVDADGTADLSADLRWKPAAGSEGTWTFASVTFAGEDLDGDGTPDPIGAVLSEPMYRTRWVSSGWTLDDAAVQIDATLDSADGSTDALSDLAVLALDASGLSEATLQARKKGGYKATFITVELPEAPVGAVSASVRDTADDSVLADIAATAPVEVVTVLSAPIGAAGGDATIALTIADADGTALLAETFAVSLAEGDVLADFAASEVLAVSEAAIVATPDGELVLRVALTGSTAGAVDAADVAVATADSESWTAAGLDYRLARWTAVFDPGAPLDEVEVSAEVRGTDGSRIDGWTFDVSTDAGGVALRTASIGGVNNNGMDPQLKGGSSSF